MIFSLLGAANAFSFSSVNSTIPAGNTVANTASETDFASQVTLPVMQAGDFIEFELTGTYSTDALLAPTLRGKIYIGATVVLDTGALTTLVGVTNVGFVARGRIIAQSVTSVDAQGEAFFATAATTTLSSMVANSSVTAVSTLATARVVKASIQWGTADADNTITLRQFYLGVGRP